MSTGIEKAWSLSHALCNRLCENSVHAFLRLRSGQAASARTGWGVSKIKYLTVRPELGRRAPIEFSHSPAIRRWKILKTLERNRRLTIFDPLSSILDCH